MEFAGWDTDTNRGIKDICTAVLSLYLANADVPVRFSIIEMITQSVSKGTVSALLKRALASKRSTEEEYFEISCHIYDDGYDVQVGSSVKLCIDSMYSIDYLRYLVLQETNIMTDKVYCDDELLDGYDLVCDTPIQPSARLEFTLPKKQE